MSLLPNALPWYVVGPAMGLLVTALYAIANQSLGSSSAYVQLIARLRGRPAADWRIWFLGGTIVGGFIATVLRGGSFPGLAYGKLGEFVPLPLLVVILLTGGVLMGYGARWAGGCTSGHGLCGNATLSKDSFAATASFMVAAIGVSLIVHVVSGGAL